MRSVLHVKIGFVVFFSGSAINQVLGESGGSGEICVGYGGDFFSRLDLEGLTCDPLRRRVLMIETLRFKPLRSGREEPRVLGRSRWL